MAQLGTNRLVFAGDPTEGPDVQETSLWGASPKSPEAMLLQNLDDAALTRIVDGLPHDHREVLVLRELEDLSYREIAAITGVPIGTVMSRLARARALLKKRWQAEGGTEARDAM